MMPAEQPTPIPLRAGEIPAAMAREPRWVGWRYVSRSGKWTKTPITPATGRLADSTDPATWGTIEAALAAVKRFGLAGVGFMLGDGWAGVDLDNSYNPRTRTLAPWARGDVEALASYTEVSPSGRGVKVFVRGRLPEGRRRTGNYELYDGDRFFTVTGHRLDGAPATVQERQEQLAALHARLFAQQTEPEPDERPALTPAPRHGLSDEQALERARAARDGAKFDALWRGDASGYASASEADLALCSLLAFWVGPDPARIDALFRRSGLCRDKWKRRADYRADTLAKAINRQEFYEPPEAQPKLVVLPGQAAEAPKDETPWIISVTDLLAEPDEPEVWLCQGLVRAQMLGLLVGPPKTYKSFFAQELSVALATGTPAFGLFEVPEAVPVVYVQEESARLYLRRRFRGILAGRGMHPATVADTLYTVTNKRFRLDEPSHIARLTEEAIEAYQPRIIFFDPMRAMHWLDENKAEAMQPIMAELTRLRDVYGLSIVVVHHNNKNPLYTAKGDKVRGSGVIWSSADGGIFIEPTAEKGRMKVEVDLKEGHGAPEFIYGIDSHDEAIRFQIVSTEPGDAPAGDEALLVALSSLGWATPADVAATVGTGERVVKARLDSLALAGKALCKKVKTAGRPKTVYGPLGADENDPDF